MWSSIHGDPPIPGCGISRSPEDGKHEMSRTAALEQADRIEQLDIEVTRDHERVAGWTAVPGETLEPGAQELFCF